MAAMIRRSKGRKNANCHLKKDSIRRENWRAHLHGRWIHLTMKTAGSCNRSSPPADYSASVAADLAEVVQPAEPAQARGQVKAAAGCFADSNLAAHKTAAGGCFADSRWAVCSKAVADSHTNPNSGPVAAEAHNADSRTAQGYLYHGVPEL